MQTNEKKRHTQTHTHTPAVPILLIQIIFEFGFRNGWVVCICICGCVCIDTNHKKKEIEKKSIKNFTQFRNKYTYKVYLYIQYIYLRKNSHLIFFFGHHFNNMESSTYIIVPHRFLSSLSFYRATKK